MHDSDASIFQTAGLLQMHANSASRVACQILDTTPRRMQLHEKNDRPSAVDRVAPLPFASSEE